MTKEPLKIKNFIFEELHVKPLEYKSGREKRRERRKN
jgi:hypothetical protein